MKYKFYPNYETVLNHISRYNPHQSGSSRDALTHGISDVHEYLWTDELLIPIDLISNIDQIGLNLRNLKSYQKQIKEGSNPPAIICIMNESGKILLVDGSHRVNALLNENKTEVKIFIGILPEILEILNNKF